MNHLFLFNLLQFPSCLENVFPQLWPSEPPPPTCLMYFKIPTSFMKIYARNLLQSVLLSLHSQYLQNNKAKRSCCRHYIYKASKSIMFPTSLMVTMHKAVQIPESGISYLNLSAIPLSPDTVLGKTLLWPTFCNPFWYHAWFAESRRDIGVRLE